MSLKDCLQRVEASGLVEYTLGGHKCERPPEVAQGLSEDAFNVSPDPDNALLWRANQIQTRSLKQSNVASHFPFSTLAQSALTLVSHQQLGFIFISNSLNVLWKWLRRGTRLTIGLLDVILMWAKISLSSQWVWGKQVQTSSKRKQIYGYRSRYIHAQSIYIYIFTYIHTYLHTYVHTYIHTYIHTYTYVLDTFKICL